MVKTRYCIRRKSFIFHNIEKNRVIPQFQYGVLNGLLIKLVRTGWRDIGSVFFFLACLWPSPGGDILNGTTPFILCVTAQKPLHQICERLDLHLLIKRRTVKLV